MSDNNPNGHDFDQPEQPTFVENEKGQFEAFPDEAEQAEEAEVLYTSDAIQAIITEMNLDYVIREKSVSLAIQANTFENIESILEDAAKIEDFVRNGKPEKNAPTD